MQKKLAIILLFMIVAVILALIVLANLKVVTYEYYTFDGERGISSKCESIDTVKCKINGEMVEVAQFSVIESEELK